MNWEVRLAGRARKNLKRFHAKDRERVLEALHQLADNPYAGDIEKIGGEENTWRRRVGNYRMVYDVDVARRLVEVRIIKRRTSSIY